VVDKKWKAEDFLLLRTFDRFYSEDLSHQLKVEGGKLTIPPLSKRGLYLLKILPLEKTINVIVLKNLDWQQ
jgi:hypothetical protein